MKTFNISEMKPADIYSLMISTIVPRPIAWVSSMSPSGKLNLAPFSYFNAVSSAPACLMLSVARKPDGNKKDTIKNIEAVPEFVVNIVNESLMNEMHQTSAEYEYEVSEWEKAGIETLASLKIKPPRVKKSPIQFECELYKTLELGDGLAGSTTMVIGKILHIHVDEKLIDKNAKFFPGIDPKLIAPLARLGGISYGTVGKVIDVARAKV